jgi:hypothetical protein
VTATHEGFCVFSIDHLQSHLAEELHNVAKDLPSREDQLKVAKKRTREHRASKKKEEHKSKTEKTLKEKRHHRRSLSDTELEAVEPALKAGGTPGRRQLNRLLSTSKKLLPRFASDSHDERPSTTNGDTPSRKFLKARRKASTSSTLDSDN